MQSLDLVLWKVDLADQMMHTCQSQFCTYLLGEEPCGALKHEHQEEEVVVRYASSKVPVVLLVAELEEEDA